MSAHILIIDDNNDFREMLTYTCKAAGFSVSEETNGQEGLKHAQEQQPDIVLTDLMLPSLNGYEICTMLKQDVRYQKIPVVILSATRTEDKHVQLAKECGCDAYIPKSTDPKQILAQVQEILNKLSQPK